MGSRPSPTTLEAIDPTIAAIHAQQNESLRQARNEHYMLEQHHDERARRRRNEELLNVQRHVVYQQQLQHSNQYANETFTRVNSSEQIQDERSACRQKVFVIMFNLTGWDCKLVCFFYNELLKEMNKRKIQSKIAIGQFGNAVFFLRPPSTVGKIKEVHEKEIMPMTTTNIIDAMREGSYQYIKQSLKDEQVNFIFLTNSKEDHSKNAAASLCVYTEDFKFKYVLISPNCMDSRNIIWFKFNTDIETSVDEIISVIEYIKKH